MHNQYFALNISGLTGPVNKGSNAQKRHCLLLSTGVAVAHCHIDKSVVYSLFDVVFLSPLPLCRNSPYKSPAHTLYCIIWLIHPSKWFRLVEQGCWEKPQTLPQMHFDQNTMFPTAESHFKLPVGDNSVVWVDCDGVTGEGQCWTLIRSPTPWKTNQDKCLGSAFLLCLSESFMDLSKYSWVENATLCLSR